MHFSRPPEPTSHNVCEKGSNGQPSPLLHPTEGGREDAQADVPLDKPRAQVAFKDSMIRGILQFTLRIAFHCVLHRCKSQDIRC